MLVAEDEEVQTQLPGLERGMVAKIAKLVLGSEIAQPGEWRVEGVGTHTGAATGGVYRVAGSATDGGVQIPWSVVLKIVSLNAPGGRGGFHDEAHPLYWKREALAYVSGLLDNLPGGIRAPRCYEAVDMGDDTIWLWLEEVKDTKEVWSLEQYARAAECLGRFNGAYLVGHPMPDYPWLIRICSPRGLLEHNSWIRDVMSDPAIWQHSIMRAAFPVPVAAQLLQLWDERELLLSALDHVPHTFGHLDAWRSNMFAQETAGSAGLTMIDWAYPGRAAVSTDAGDLFGESFCLSELGDTEPHLLDQAVFEGYVAGLRESGWRGNEQVVRFAFTAFCALKHLFLCFVSLKDIPDEGRHDVWERLFGRPFAEYVERQAIFLYYVLDLANEVRSLLVSKRLCFT